MDTFLSNGNSLSQDEGATFGEYQTTTKVNGVLSRFIPDIDAIPSAEEEFGRFQKTSYEIGSNSDRPDIDYLKATSEGIEIEDFQEKTNLVGSENNYLSNFDVLQATNAGVEEGAQFGEYRTTTKLNGVQSIFTPSVDAIPSAEDGNGNIDISVPNNNGENLGLQNLDFANSNLEGLGTQFNDSGEVQQSTSETNPFELANSVEDSGAVFGETLNTNQNAGFETQYDSNINFAETNTVEEAGAQFGEYRTTTKVDGVESIYTPSIDAIPSAENVIGANDFTASTPTFDTNISESMPLVDTTSDLNIMEASTSNNYDFTNSEPIIDTTANQFESIDFTTSTPTINENYNMENEQGFNNNEYQAKTYESAEKIFDSATDTFTQESNDYNPTIDTAKYTENYQSYDNNPIIDSATVSNIDIEAKEDYQNFETTPINNWDNNYQNIETTPIIDVDITTKNYETTPIIDIDTAAENYQNIETTQIFDIDKIAESNI